jgi:hypothetical protein
MRVLIRLTAPSWAQVMTRTKLINQPGSVLFEQRA